MIQEKVIFQNPREECILKRRKQPTVSNAKGFGGGPRVKFPVLDCSFPTRHHVKLELHFSETLSLYGESWAREKLVLRF